MRKHNWTTFPLGFLRIIAWIWFLGSVLIIFMTLRGDLGCEKLACTWVQGHIGEVSDVSNLVDITVLTWTFSFTIWIYLIDHLQDPFFHITFSGWFRQYLPFHSFVPASALLFSEIVIFTVSYLCKYRGTFGLCCFLQFGNILMILILTMQGRGSKQLMAIMNSQLGKANRSLSRRRKRGLETDYKHIPELFLLEATEKMTERDVRSRKLLVLLWQQLLNEAKDPCWFSYLRQNASVFAHGNGLQNWELDLIVDICSGAMSDERFYAEAGIMAWLLEQYPEQDQGTEILLRIRANMQASTIEGRVKLQNKMGNFLLIWSRYCYEKTAFPGYLVFLSQAASLMREGWNDDVVELAKLVPIEEQYGIASLLQEK